MANAKKHISNGGISDLLTFCEGSIFGWDSIPRPTLGRTRENGVWVWTWAILSRPQEGSLHPLTSSAGQKLLSSPPT